MYMYVYIYIYIFLCTTHHYVLYTTVSTTPVYLSTRLICTHIHDAIRIDVVTCRHQLSRSRIQLAHGDAKLAGDGPKVGNPEMPSGKLT